MTQNTEISLLSILQKSDDQISTELDDEVVLMSLEKGSYFGLNSVSSCIWKMLEKPVQVSAICGNLMEEYDVSKKQCETEVMETLKDLFEKGLIKKL